MDQKNGLPLGNEKIVDKADELAKGSADRDDACAAEIVAKIFERRCTFVKYAANFHSGVEKLRDVEEITEEMKVRHKGLHDVGSTQSIVCKYRMIILVNGETLYRCQRCNKKKHSSVRKFSEFAKAFCGSLKKKEPEKCLKASLAKERTCGRTLAAAVH